MLRKIESVSSIKVGVRQAVQAALIVAGAAQHNRRSRGCHYRDDTWGTAVI